MWNGKERGELKIIPKFWLEVGEWYYLMMWERHVGKTSGWVGLGGKSGFLFGHVRF